MPYARLEVPTGLDPRQHDAMLDALDEALSRVLGVPRNDSFLRLYEYQPGRARVPRIHGPRFVFVEVQLFAGRSRATKARLYQAIVAALTASGVPATDITIALLDIPLDNWGIRGGQPASDVALGIEIA